MYHLRTYPKAVYKKEKIVIHNSLHAMGENVLGG